MLPRALNNRRMLYTANRKSMKTGFEPRSCDVGNNHPVNCATTTFAKNIKILLVNLEFTFSASSTIEQQQRRPQYLPICDFWLSKWPWSWNPPTADCFVFYELRARFSFQSCCCWEASAVAAAASLIKNQIHIWFWNRKV